MSRRRRAGGIFRAAEALWEKSRIRGDSRHAAGRHETQLAEIIAEK
jgi:hypothetical protein